MFLLIIENYLSIEAMEERLVFKNNIEPLAIGRVSFILKYFELRSLSISQISRLGSLGVLTIIVLHLLFFS